MALLQHEMKKEKTHRQVIEGGVLQVGPLRGRIGVVSTEPADEEDKSNSIRGASRSGWSYVVIRWSNILGANRRLANAKISMLQENKRDAAFMYTYILLLIRTLIGTNMAFA